MIYAESLRHFAQEWIEIQHPRDYSVEDWPWDTGSRLYIVNLYCVSATQEMTMSSKPQPMVSILINSLPTGKDRIITESDAIYRGYFTKDSFKLPRRYLYNPLNKKADHNQRTNRFDFTSDGYGEMASNWATEDLAFLKILGRRKHIRRTIYDDTLYHAIRKRLDQLAEAAEVEHIAMADNLLDATKEVQDVAVGSTETFLIQVPCMGNVYPIKKSKNYKLIHGILINCAEDCLMAIPDEPCYQDYMDALIPFNKNLGKVASGMTLRYNTTKTVAYIVVEATKGTFQFQEFLPGDKLMSGGMWYVRTLVHHFCIEPEVGNASTGREIVVRLRHHIQQGLLPDTKANKIYMTRRGVKLFHRSDIPEGFKRSASGEVSISIGG